MGDSSPLPKGKPRPSRIAELRGFCVGPLGVQRKAGEAGNVSFRMFLCGLFGFDFKK